MKVSVILPARDKARHVGRCVDSLLSQRYDGDLEIVLSDQCSTDDTLAVMQDAADRYDGPHKVMVVRCPIGDYKGMAGLNAHFNWLHGQIDGDLVIQCSADDYALPGRVAATARVFSEHSPSFIGCRMRIETPDGENAGVTGAFPNCYSRMVTSAEAIQHQIGSSGGQAWARDLYEKHGPLNGVESEDIIIPMMALMERGFYFIDRTLHVYVNHAGYENTGMEGQLRQAQSDGDQMGLLRLTECNNMHNASNWLAVYRRWVESGDILRLSPGANLALAEKVVGSANAWAAVRDQMTLARIEPVGMRV